MGGRSRNCEGPIRLEWAFLMDQIVKNLAAKREIQVWPLGWEDPLEKGMWYFCLENSMDRGSWQATVHGVC